ncbi:MAG: hypothetical protein KatS3mg034_1013 [Vicingaceae bacterium]|nr:MAG: hypothetical protein KatS3mg034_1013 [Vicingaceae bacterium]
MKKNKVDENKLSGRSYREYVIKQFKKNRLAVISLYIIIVLAFVALFADFLANEKPIVCSYKGKIYFPVLKQYAVDLNIGQWDEEFQNIPSWKDLPYDWAVFPPVPYLPKNIDFDNAQSVGPFDKQFVKSWRWRHWLGTDELGRDVLAGMIHGTRIALLVGFVSMGIAAVIGILIGSLAGFLGDQKLKMTVAGIIFNLLALFFGIFYGFGSRSYILKEALGNSMFHFIGELMVSLFIIAVIFLVFNLMAKGLQNAGFFGKKVSVPVDIIISRLIELMLSIPTLFLIISIAAISKPSIFTVMAIIGFTSWTGIARFIRAELLRIRSLEFIEAAYALGFKERRILLKHAIPNALSPVFVAIAFGIASAILIEATLSFIGIGVPAETVTWGSLLSAARQSSGAWWLAIIPGFAIFLTVTIYNLVGEGLTDALDPRQKR